MVIPTQETSLLSAGGVTEPLPHTCCARNGSPHVQSPGYLDATAVNAQATGTDDDGLGGLEATALPGAATTGWARTSTL